MASLGNSLANSETEKPQDSVPPFTTETLVPGDATRSKWLHFFWLFFVLFIAVSNRQTHPLALPFPAFFWRAPDGGFRHSGL
jgi:hypothetical protein